MRWLTNFYYFRSKWTATAAIEIYPTGCHRWLISKMQSSRGRFRRTICNKILFETWKNATKTHGMLQTAFRPPCVNWASVFEWHNRFKEGTESVRDDEKCGRSNEVNTPELIGQRVRAGVTMLRFYGSSGRDSVRRDQNSWNQVSGISTRTMHQSTTPFLSQTIWPILLFPKHRGCRYETIEKMKEAVTKVIDMLTQEDFHGAF